MSCDAPPSYHSVVNKVNKLVGPNPTASKILHVAKSLPQSDLNILADSKNELPPWTPESKAAFALGVAKEMVSPEGAENLRISAGEAAAACKQVEAMFLDLTQQLSAIDSKNTPPKEGPFAPRLAVLNDAFHNTVLDSKDLAVKIAIYGRRFDEVIIPICSDKNLSVEQRRVKIDQFIQDADTFSKEAEAMTTRFFKLKSDFAIFTGSFDGWAADKEDADTKALAQARKDLTELNEKLSKLQIAFYSIAAVAVATLPATAVIAALSGPLAPFVVIAGLIFAGITAGTTIGLAVAIKSTEGDISAKNDEIKRLEEEIQQIKVTRSQLQLLGATNLAEFSKSIDVLSLVWQTAHNDALRIKEWLDDGAKDADMPEYMKVSLDHAVSIYKTMADYLDQYADGIITI